MKDTIQPVIGAVSLWTLFFSIVVSILDLLPFQMNLRISFDSHNLLGTYRNTFNLQIKVEKNKSWYHWVFLSLRVQPLPPEFCPQPLTIHSLQPLTIHSSLILVSVEIFYSWVCAPGNLWFSVSACHFYNFSFLCDLSTLIHLRKVADFQFLISFFSCCGIWMTAKLLTFKTINSTCLKYFYDVTLSLGKFSIYWFLIPFFFLFYRSNLENVLKLAKILVYQNYIYESISVFVSKVFKIYVLCATSVAHLLWLLWF